MPDHGSKDHPQVSLFLPGIVDHVRQRLSSLFKMSPDPAVDFQVQVKHVLPGRQFLSQAERISGLPDPVDRGKHADKLSRLPAGRTAEDIFPAPFLSPGLQYRFQDLLAGLIFIEDLLSLPGRLSRVSGEQENGLPRQFLSLLLRELVGNDQAVRLFFLHPLQVGIHLYLQGQLPLLRQKHPQRPGISLLRITDDQSFTVPIVSLLFC